MFFLFIFQNKDEKKLADFQKFKFFYKQKRALYPGNLEYIYTPVVRSPRTGSFQDKALLPPSLHRVPHPQEDDLVHGGQEQQEVRDQSYLNGKCQI